MQVSNVSGRFARREWPCDPCPARGDQRNEALDRDGAGAMCASRER
jgi:hypothetical protein